MAADYPPADATREQVRAWRGDPPVQRAGRITGRKVRKPPRCSKCGMAGHCASSSRCPQRKRVACAACGKMCDPSPLRDPVRIRFSAKFKGRTFGTGQTLCHRHSVEPLHEARP